MGQTSTHTELRLVNDTNTDIINIVVSEVDSYDWHNDNRPDNNFNGVSINAKSSLQRPEELNAKAGHCPFNMTLYFRDGSKDSFRIHQKYAVGCCHGFQFFERSHSIIFTQRGSNVLEIIISNTSQQLQNEQAEQLNKQGLAALNLSRYQEALAKFDEALLSANVSDTINSINTNKKLVLGNEVLEQAWIAEADESRDRSQEAKGKFEEALRNFQEAGDLTKARLVQTKINGNRLFNEGNALESQGYDLFVAAGKSISSNSYTNTKNKYKGALGKYEEAKGQFVEGLKTDGKFESSVTLTVSAIEGVNKVIGDIGKVELNHTLNRAEIDDKDQEERKDIEENTEEKLQHVINS